MAMTKQTLADKEANYRCNSIRPECRDDVRGAARAFGVSMLIADKWRRRVTANPIDCWEYTANMHGRGSQ